MVVFSSLEIVTLSQLAGKGNNSLGQAHCRRSLGGSDDPLIEDP